MALSVISLFAQTLTAAAISYLAPPNTGVIVKSILLVNKTANARTVTVQLTKVGFSAVNVCPPGMTIPANSSVNLDATITLGNGDAIALWADLASSVDAIMSGMVRDN